MLGSIFFGEHNKNSRFFITEGFRIDGSIEAEDLFQLRVQEGVQTGQRGRHDRGHGLLRSVQGGACKPPCLVFFRQQTDDPLELILATWSRRCQQILNDFEHRNNVSGILLTVLCNQQNGCGQQAFSCIVEECVLTEGCTFHAGHDDCFGNDLGILFGFCLIRKVIRVFLPKIHILVDQVQQVIAIRFGRITQVDNGNFVAVIVLCDLTIMTVQVTLGVGSDEGHSRCASIFQVRIQKIGRLADASCTDHKRMDITSVYHSSGATFGCFTSDDDALIFRRRAFVAFAPSLWPEWDVFVSVLDFLFPRPARCTVLSVTNCLGFDIVQVIDVG